MITRSEQHDCVAERWRARGLAIGQDLLEIQAVLLCCATPGWSAGRKWRTGQNGNFGFQSAHDSDKTALLPCDFTWVATGRRPIG